MENKKETKQNEKGIYETIETIETTPNDVCIIVNDVTPKNQKKY